MIIILIIISILLWLLIIIGIINIIRKCKNTLYCYYSYKSEYKESPKTKLNVFKELYYLMIYSHGLTLDKCNDEVIKISLREDETVVYLTDQTIRLAGVDFNFGFIDYLKYRQWRKKEVINTQITFCVYKIDKEN